MIGGVTHLGGLPGLPGRVTLSARVAFCHVNDSRWGNPPSRGRVWHAVCSKIQSSQIFIQSNHFGMMQFNLIFQTYSNNPKKHSIQTHVSQFNLVRVNIYSIQSQKYLFNPITKIFIQSNHGNIYSISKIFIQSNHGNIYSIQS